MVGGGGGGGGVEVVKGCGENVYTVISVDEMLQVYIDVPSEMTGSPRSVVCASLHAQNGLELSVLKSQDVIAGGAVVVGGAVVEIELEFAVFGESVDEVVTPVLRGTPDELVTPVLRGTPDEVTPEVTAVEFDDTSDVVDAIVVDVVPGVADVVDSMSVEFDGDCVVVELALYSNE